MAQLAALAVAGRAVNYLRSRLVTVSGEVYPSDDVIVANGTLTLTPPPAERMVGRAITVVNVGTLTVTFDPDGSELVNGVATKAWATQYQSHTFFACLTAANTYGWVILQNA